MRPVSHVVLEPVAICPRCKIHVAENADQEYWCHGCHKDLTGDVERFRAKHASLKKGVPWPDPGIPDERYGTVDNLYDAVKGFFEDHLDLMDPREYDVLASFTLASYRQQDFEAVPYLFFLGPPNSGKSRALECLWQVCHRGILVSSISTSALFRSVDLWHPTLLADECDAYTADESAEIRAILNSGYRRGQVVVRSVKVGKGEGDYEIGQFETYSFKALAATREMRDTLRSRCITIHMQRATRNIRPSLDIESAAKLREALHHYELQHDGSNLTAEALARLISDLRVVELFLPLVTVAPTQETQRLLVEYAQEIARSRIEDESTTLEARVLEALLSLEEEVSEDGKLAVKDISDKLNEGAVTDDDRIPSFIVGKVLAQLGFRRVRVGHTARRGVLWSEPLVKRLKARYAPYLLPPETPVSVSANGQSEPEKALTGMQTGTQTGNGSQRGLLSADLSSMQTGRQEN